MAGGRRASEVPGAVSLRPGRRVHGVLVDGSATGMHLHFGVEMAAGGITRIAHLSNLLPGGQGLVPRVLCGVNG